MIKEAIEQVLSLAPPNLSVFGELQYSDKRLDLITPPAPLPVECSTLQGFADLYLSGIDGVKSNEVLVQVTDPSSVDLISKNSDKFGRRRVWVRAEYPEMEGFKFNQWHKPESFIISVQQHFQRVKIENGDGSFAPDLDYVLGIASKVTAENSISHDDDGFAQRVAVKQGVALKAETVLKPTVQLAPYRTFSEIDQVISQFVFRAKISEGDVLLALFDGDGGRWKLGAVAGIKGWLQPKFGDVPVIS